MNSPRHLALCALLLGLGAACSNELRDGVTPPGPVLGPTPCDDDDDCASGTCLDGACEAIPGCDDDACEPGPECVADGDCREGLACRDGLCVLPAQTGGCTSDDECEPGAPCVRGVCEDPACRTGSDCARGETCTNGVCVTSGGCVDDDACGPGQQCEEGVCVGGGECLRDADCGPNRVCDARVCVSSAPCSSNADCAAGAQCIASVCVPRICRGNTDCAAGQACEGGRCIEPPDAEIVSVILLTPSRSLRPGDTLTLQAAALDARQQVIPGLGFTFEAQDPNILSIADASLSGGAQPGTTAVRARVAGTSAPVSEPTLFTNLGAAPGGTRRVAVVNRVTGVPVGGATVRIGAVEVTTDPQGLASFPGAPSGPVEVNADGFALLTVLDNDAPDLLLPLGPDFRARDTSGFRGEMNFDAVASRGDARVGLAGAAIEGDLIDLDLTDIIGTTFQTSFGGGPLGSLSLPLPAGLVLSVDAFGIGDVKSTYYAQSSAGLTFAWALGGRLPANNLIGLFGGGGGGLTSILRNLLPLFETFDHTATAFVGEARPLVPDTDDINNNGDRTELLPDYERFPELPLRPSVPLRYRTQIGFPLLPALGGRPAALAAVVGGMIVDGVGFVPTGLSAAGGAQPGLPPDPVVLRMAPPSGGLSLGTFAVVLLAFEAPAPGSGGGLGGGLGGGGAEVGDTIAGRVFTGERLPEIIDFAGELFPAAPSDVALEGSRLSAAASANDLVRLRIEGTERTWEVLAPGSVAIDLDLPEGLGSVDGAPALDVVQLRGSATWTELLAPSGPTLLTLSTSASGFLRGRGVLR